MPGEGERAGAVPPAAEGSAAGLGEPGVAYRALFEGAPSAILIADETGRYVDVNRAALTLLGYERTELLALRVADVVAEEAPWADDEYARFVATGEWRGELSLRRKDGSVVPVEAHARSIPLPDGRTAYTSFVRNLSERKRIEAELRLSEERLRQAVEAAELGTWEWDMVHDRVTWSPRQCALFGTTPEAFGGRIADVMALVHPEDQVAAERSAIQAVDTTRDDYVVEHRVRRPDGGEHWLMAWGRLFRDADGHPVRMVGVTIDVTARKAGERHREAIQRGEKLRALGQMASGVAHDLNQSLAIIAGYGEVATRTLDAEVPDLAAVRESVALIREAASDGGQAVKRLLGFARVRPEGPEERVELRPLLEQVAQLTAPRWRDAAQAEARPIRLDVEVEGGPTVLGWPSTLREALINLVMNAVDALPRGGEIRLRAVQHADRVAVEVTDTGVGMPPEIRSRILEPFFTTKGEGGTGLGLPLVQGVVERHGGQLELESQLGAGTTVRLLFPPAERVSTLPISTSPTSTSPRMRPAREDQLEATPALRILAVDDEPTLAGLMGRVLSAEGHEVVTATTPEAALEHLEAGRFDLLITDLGLGTGMNGWELIERVRARRPEIRVVLATGWGPEIDQAAARERGVEAVISKPYRGEALRRAVAGVASRAE